MIARANLRKRRDSDTMGITKKVVTLTKLIIYEELNGTETVFEDFELITTRILIGSSPDNQLVLEAPDIDPAHASLELRYDHWVLQDLGAPGGTVVNGQTVNGPHQLKHNDLIELGSVKMRFHDIVPEVEAASESSEEVEPESPPSSQVSGRIWFVKVAAGTAALIFLILFLLISAHYLGLLNVGDLLPPWLSQ